MRFDSVYKIIFLLMTAAIAAVAVSEVHSFDVFWQLQSGKYIWQTKNFIRTDLFTLAKDVPRFEHAWGHGLILYAIYSLFGYGGISVLKGVIITITAVVLVLAARMRPTSWLACLLVLPLFLLTSGGWLERPQVWTFLLFASFVLILRRFEQKPAWYILWLFPLAVFWANVHAASVLGVAIYAAFFVSVLVRSLRLRDFRSTGFFKLLVAGTSIVAAAFLTPYPSKLWHTLVTAPRLGASIDKSTGKAVGSTLAVFNMDWTPTTFQQEPLFFYVMGGCLVVMLMGWRWLRLSDVCLLLGLSLMGLKLVRHIPFFYMGAVVVLPCYLDAIGEVINRRLPRFLKILAPFALCALGLYIFWFNWQPLARVYGYFNAGLREWHYPIAATDFVEKHQLPPNLYNTYDWGGYMAWRLYPDYLVFWDGRQDSAEMFNMGWQVMAGHPGWETILNNHNVNTIVTRASTIDTGQKYPLLDRLKEDSDWQLVFNTESSLVFVRESSVPTGWLQRHVLPKEKIDDTVLSEAHLMVNVNANRYMAWWEMAQIYMKRRQYSHAFFALEQHLQRTPTRNPTAEQYYRMLYPKYGKRDE